MSLRPAAELGAAIGEHTAHDDLVLVEEWHHPVVHQVGGGERRLAIIELGEGHLGVGVDSLVMNKEAPNKRRAPRRTIGARPYRALSTTTQKAAHAYAAKARSTRQIHLS